MVVREGYGFRKLTNTELADLTERALRDNALVLLH